MLNNLEKDENFCKSCLHFDVNLNKCKLCVNNSNYIERNTSGIILYFILGLAVAALSYFIFIF